MTNMKNNTLPEDQNILCLFAHPDDESFGPAGTIATLSKNNSVSLVCVTDGAYDEQTREEVSATRSKELSKACKVLGIEDHFILGFPDGSLSLRNYHAIYTKVMDCTPTITHLSVQFDHNF